MDKTNIYEYILGDGKKRCKKGYKRVPKTMRCRVAKYLKQQSTVNKKPVSKTLKQRKVLNNKGKELIPIERDLLMRLIQNKKTLELEKKSEKERNIREKERINKEAQRKKQIAHMKNQKKTLYEKRERERLKSIVEYELKEKENRCKKGFKRVPKTRKCLNIGLTMKKSDKEQLKPKQLHDKDKDKDKETEKDKEPTPIIKYILGDKEKRCKNGYLRIPKTNTCLKKTAKKSIDTNKTRKRDEKEKEKEKEKSPGFFTKLFRPRINNEKNTNKTMKTTKTIVLPEKTVRKVRKLKRIKTIKRKSTIPHITPVSEPIQSIVDITDTPRKLQGSQGEIVIIERNPKSSDDIATKLKTLIPSINKYGFITTINRNIDDITTLTKRRNVTECIDNYRKIYNWQISEPTDLDVRLKDGSCVSSNSDIGKRELIKMLYRDTKPHCIIAPRQSAANCWMNCLFMSYFISDLAAHHNKWMRRAMITSQPPNGDKFTDENLNIIFRRLNMSIQASFDCNNTHVSLLDTNELIKELYTKILPSRKLTEFYRLQDVKTRKIGDAGNPIEYFKLLTLYLSGLRRQKEEPFISTGIFPISFNIQDVNPSNVETEYLDCYYDGFDKHSNHYDYKNITNMSIISYNNTRNNTYIPKYIRYIDIHNKIPVSVFKLDNINLIDNIKAHFVSFITIKNNYYAFDGASFSKLHSFDWTKYINKNVNMRFSLNEKGENLGSDFNFMVGYGEYNYYRV